MSEDVFNRIAEILAKQAKVDPSQVDRSATMLDLGLDSLGRVECLFAIEEAFDIHIPFDNHHASDHGIDTTPIGALADRVQALLADPSG